MQPNKKIFKLVGTPQHYAWGGVEFIPSLLGFNNSESRQYAEYWMGAHPSASGRLLDDGQLSSWYELIQQEPVTFLGEDVFERFGELPYLFKVLDVKEMLSIQVHPTKHEAVKGFEREEAAGIPINATHRNYKDKNHKPEVMVALSDFWLLHGFKKEDELKKVLLSIPEFAGLLPVFKKEGYFGLYKAVMEFTAEETNLLLEPLIKRELQKPHDKSEPGFWVNKLYEKGFDAKNLDKGTFSIYFFNIVKLTPGQAIYQAAGVPHAYLEGQNVELMANSDNVLRGGLTPKHIDVDELLKHTLFEGIEPNILHPEIANNGEIIYPLPIEDFGISAIQLQAAQEYDNRSESSEVFLVMSGEVRCDDELVCKRGEAFVVLPQAAYTFTGLADDTLLYKAFVP